MNTENIAENILGQLNPSQRSAVEKNEGPLMVLAGAGSGKTKTLVAKMAYLLSQERNGPMQILALTFSNKAAKEMRERLFRHYNLPIGPLMVSTFHSFCAYVLRQEGEHLGIGTNFTIYDRSESKAIVKTILENRDFDLKKNPLQMFLNYIDEMKNQGHYLGRNDALYDIEKIQRFNPEEEDEFYSIFVEYERELAKANAVDFGGLITSVLQLFERFPQVKLKYQRRFQYVLVDEYQDTNRAQFELIVYLSKLHQRLCVVGDEDQSIYSWRGADIRNILEFDSVFPTAETVKLEQNYRSTKKIIEAASFVIAHNTERKGKRLWTDNEEGAPIAIKEFNSDRDEAAQIASSIQKVLQSSAEFTGDDIAVLYRTNAQSRLFEESFRREGIRYRIVGGIEFYERKEIKDILAYMRVILNPQDSLSFSRIINIPPRGIGAVTIRKLEQDALQKNCSLWQSLCQLTDDNKNENASDWKLSQKLLSSLKEFRSLIESQRSNLKNSVLPSEIYRQILDTSGIVSYFKAAKDYESLGRIENLEEFYSALVQYEQGENNPNLAHFLESVTLDQDRNLAEDSSTSDNDFKNQGTVSLMTVHSAKGLEFPYVYIVGVEENLFPSYLGVKEGRHGLEEERRLFYVAMTRAMKHLTLSFAQSRMLYGELNFNGPGQFLREIPEEFYTWHAERSWNSPQKNSFGPSFNSSSIQKGFDSKSTYKIGSRINHQLFGEGIVKSSMGIGEDEKVVISFPPGIQKTFKVKFAPLTLINKDEH